MCKRNERGQSIGEYAVLLAIILGAVVGMQALVRNRVAGAIDSRSNAYMSEAGGGAGAQDLKRASQSTSTARSTMTSSRAGDVKTGSKATQQTENPLR